MYCITFSIQGTTGRYRKRENEKLFKPLNFNMSDTKLLLSPRSSHRRNACRFVLCSGTDSGCRLSEDVEERPCNFVPVSTVRKATQTIPPEIIAKGVNRYKQNKFLTFSSLLGRLSSQPKRGREEVQAWHYYCYYDFV